MPTRNLWRPVLHLLFAVAVAAAGIRASGVDQEPALAGAGQRVSPSGGSGSGGGSGSSSNTRGAGRLLTSSGSSGGVGDSCPEPSLWEVAKNASDLRALVAVQKLTPLNFFSPFGKHSDRDFTLIAPTDAALRVAFEEATAEGQLQELESGFPALLLYHQVLSQGYSASELARKYTMVTELGRSVDQRLTIDIDQQEDTGKVVISGLAPQNYANVLREYESCGAWMLVVDTLLRPAAAVSQLPKLQTEQPINATQWAAILAALEGGAPPPTPAAGSGPAAISSGGVASSGAGGGSSGTSPPEPQEQGVFQITEAPAGPPSPPPSPGSPPDCAALAAAGQLISANSTLAASGCATAVASTVISSGTTLTAVSDAGQLNLSALELPAPGSWAAAAAAARAALLAPVCLAALLLFC